MNKLFGALLAVACIAQAGYKSSGGYSSSSSRSSSSSSSSRSYSSPSYSAPKSNYSAPSRPSISSAPTRVASTPVRPVYTPPARPTVAPTPVRPSYTPPVNANSVKSPALTNSGIQSRNSYPTNSPTQSRVNSYPTNTNRYSTYNRPITRTPNWYRPNYSYHFSSPRYNSGYSYYPIMCDPWHGTLSALVAGALVTHMILDNGHRQPIYADGYGSAYTVVNGQQVEVAQDVNGNWVQLNPTQQASVSYEQPQVQQVQTAQQQAPVVVVKEKKGLGFWGWIGVLAAIGVVTILGFSIYSRVKGNGW